MKIKNYSKPPTYHIDNSPGCGCAGEPPGHPRYFVRAIYTKYGNNPPYKQAQYYLNGAGYTELEDVDKLFKPLPLEHPRTQAWIASTFQHHAHCYQDPTITGSWSDKMIIFPVPGYKLKSLHSDERFSDECRAAAQVVVNNEIIAHAEKVSTPDNHEATIIIRRHYPEFQPTHDLIHNPQKVTAIWWERLEVKPTPETCPGSVSLRRQHPVNTTWCQVCGYLVA